MAATVAISSSATMSKRLDRDGEEMKHVVFMGKSEE
jgi:hypothetical protein